MRVFEGFVTCLINILEGRGETDSPIDAGGHTVGGLSKGTRDRLGLGDNLTYDQIKEVYYREYWLRFGCDKMPPVVAWMVCDIFVNHSPKTAAVIIQRAIPSLKVDGAFGPKSRTACEKITDYRSFIKDYSFHRRGHYARRTAVLLMRYTRQLDKTAKGTPAYEATQEKVNLTITQEHGWQNRLDRLFDGIWQSGYLRRHPNKTEEITKTATVATAAATTVAVATGAASPIMEVATKAIEMAVDGDITTVGLTTTAITFAYNRWLKNVNILPKWAKKLIGKQ